MMMSYDEGNDVESYSWVIPSIMDSQSFVALPEMPLQPSLSSDDIEFLISDSYNKPQDLHAKTSIVPHVQDKHVTQNQGLLTQTLNLKDTKPKRSREVHTLSERKRRSRINEQIKTLQELMPNCKKKDRASILDEAAKHVRALQLQLEAMKKLQEAEFAAQSSQYVNYPGMQFPYVPIQQGGAGAGICVGCYARCTPFIQLPSPASAVAGIGLPTNTRPPYGHNPPSAN